MMKFTRTQEVEIDEQELASDLADFIYEVIGYQDQDFADELENGDGDYEIQILAMLDKIGELWHKQFLEKAIDKMIAPEKEVYR